FACVTLHPLQLKRQGPKPFGSFHRLGLRFARKLDRELMIVVRSELPLYQLARILRRAYLIVRDHPLKEPSRGFSIPIVVVNPSNERTQSMRTIYYKNVATGLPQN